MTVADSEKASPRLHHASICLVASLLLFGVVAGGFAVSKRIYILDFVTPPIGIEHVPVQEFLLMYVIFLGLLAAGYAISRKMTGFSIFALASWVLLIPTTMVFEDPCNADEFFYSYLVWITAVGFLITRFSVSWNAKWFLASGILFILFVPLFFVLKPILSIYTPSYYFLGLALCFLPPAGIVILQHRNRHQTTQ